MYVSVIIVIILFQYVPIVDLNNVCRTLVLLVKNHNVYQGINSQSVRSFTLRVNFWTVRYMEPVVDGLATSQQIS